METTNNLPNTLNELLMKDIPEEKLFLIRDRMCNFCHYHLNTYDCNYFKEKIQSATCLNDIANLITKLMHTEDAVTWNMMFIFSEFENLIGII